MAVPQSRHRRDHGHSTVGPFQAGFDNTFQPRSLRRCVRGVLSGTNYTSSPCMEEGRPRNPIPTPDRELIRNNLKIEARQFHKCMCELHSLSGHCKFNLLMIQSNRTVLGGCWEQENINANIRFQHPSKGSKFTCDLRGSHRVRCRRNDDHIKPVETRFEHVLNCLSGSLKGIPCPASTPTTTLTPGWDTTVAPPQARMVIFIMALVISLLLGALGAWLGVYCWRKKKRKNRPLPPLMTRPEHASLPNLYDEEYSEDHIYDIVKPDDSPTSHPIPDLLSRVPSLPPMTNRTPKSRVHVEPDKSKAAFNKTEMYEPLLRGHTISPDGHNTEPKSPVTSEDIHGPDYLPLLPDRRSREIPPSEHNKRVHPYDTVTESEVEIEAQDESITTPKIIDSPKDRKTSGNDYFILEPQPSTLKAGTGDAKNNTGIHPDTTPERKSKPGTNQGEISPNDSGYVVSPLSEEDAKSDAPKDIDTKTNHDSDQDSDGYEIPVPEETPFDIASTYVKTAPHVLDVAREDVLDV